MEGDEEREPTAKRKKIGPKTNSRANKDKLKRSKGCIIPSEDDVMIELRDRALGDVEHFAAAEKAYVKTGDRPFTRLKATPVPHCFCREIPGNAIWYSTLLSAADPQGLVSKLVANFSADHATPLAIADVLLVELEEEPRIPGTISHEKGLSLEPRFRFKGGQSAHRVAIFFKRRLAHFCEHAVFAVTISFPAYMIQDNDQLIRKWAPIMYKYGIATPRFTTNAGTCIARGEGCTYTLGCKWCPEAKGCSWAQSNDTPPRFKLRRAGLPAEDHQALEIDLEGEMNDLAQRISSLLVKTCPTAAKNMAVEKSRKCRIGNQPHFAGLSITSDFHARLHR